MRRYVPCRTFARRAQEHGTRRSEPEKVPPPLRSLLACSRVHNTRRRPCAAFPQARRDRSRRRIGEAVIQSVRTMSCINEALACIMHGGRDIQERRERLRDRCEQSHAWSISPPRPTLGYVHDTTQKRPARQKIHSGGCGGTQESMGARSCCVRAIPTGSKGRCKGLTLPCVVDVVVVVPLPSTAKTQRPRARRP